MVLDGFAYTQAPEENSAQEGDLSLLSFIFSCHLHLYDASFASAVATNETIFKIIF